MLGCHSSFSTLYSVDKQPQGYLSCSTIAFYGRLLSLVDLTYRIGNAIFQALFHFAMVAFTISKMVTAFLATGISGIFYGVSRLLGLSCKEFWLEAMENCWERTIENPDSLVFHGILMVTEPTKSIAIAVGDVFGIFFPELGRKARAYDRKVEEPIEEQPPQPTPDAAEMLSGPDPAFADEPQGVAPL